MKDQMCNLMWDICVFIKSLEAVKIPIYVETKIGENGGITESMRFYIYGVKEENISVQIEERDKVHVTIKNARIHATELSWNLSEDWAPNISTAGYIDLDIIHSDLMFQMKLEEGAAKRLAELRLLEVQSQLVEWEAKIKHSAEPKYAKYTGIQNGRIKSAIENAITQKIHSHFLEKTESKSSIDETRQV